MSNKAKGKKTAGSPRIVNRQARHKFHIHETLEVGLVLVGSEVKSVRAGQVSLAEGYARVNERDMGLYLHGIHIGAYTHAGPQGHDPIRARKLLAHKREIAKLLGQTTTGGTTLVPLSMYFVRGLVKLELGVATGKKKHDQRQDLKTREAQREIRRGMTRRIL